MKPLIEQANSKKQEESPKLSLVKIAIKEVNFSQENHDEELANKLQIILQQQTDQKAQMEAQTSLYNAIKAYVNMKRLTGNLTMKTIQPHPTSCNTPNTNHNHLKTTTYSRQLSTINQQKTYQQLYKLQYHRQLHSLHETHTHNIQTMFLEQNQSSLIVQKNIQSKIHTPISFDSILNNQTPFIFAVQSNAVFELTWRQVDISNILTKTSDQPFSNVKNNNNKIQQLPHNIYWSRFPLQPFLNIPFTHHEVELQLFHPNEVNSREKRDTHKVDEQVKEIQQKTCTMGLSIFCIPGDGIWGELSLKSIKIDKWLTRTTTNKPINVNLTISFSDIDDPSKLTKIQLPALTLQPEEQPIWNTEIHIVISPNRNLLSIEFMQLEKNNIDPKQVIGTSTIDLIQDGYLTGDRVEKSVPLWTQQTNSYEDKKVCEVTFECKFTQRQSKYLQINNPMDKKPFVNPTLNFI